jgi:CheY-like chemotaxis protein
MTDHELLEARAQIARLQRRVERERTARRESEEIAERSLRRLYARQRALDLLTRSAAASNAATDESDAFLEVMTMIAQEYEWSVGHLLVPARDDASALVSSGIWVGDPGDRFYEQIRSASVGARFARGVGIPGRVASHGPRWEVQPTDLVPARRGLLTTGSAFAFGVMVEDVLVGVVEFLSPVPKPVDPDLVDVAIPMGEQLGRVIERAKARESEQLHRDELERTVKQRTDDLMRARDRAEALSRARSALFNAVTHELSTPVHAAQAALAAHPADLDTARSQLSVMSQRIDALVALASDSAGADIAKPAICSLPDLLNEVCQTQETLVSEHGGHIQLTVDPSAAEEVLVDAERLRSALHTLLAGYRLAQPGAQVSVRLSLSGHRAQLETRSPDTDPEPGSISVARRTCQEADGDLTHEGFRYEISVPVARPRLRRSGINRRVLLVDDTKVTQQLASMMLSESGLDVDMADDGLAAIARLSERDYGVVLMDIRMPRLDGLSATRRIRAGEAGATRSETPIVAMTADTAPGAAEAGMLAGVDAYLSKPFTQRQLLAIIDRYLPAASSG